MIQILQEFNVLALAFLAGLMVMLCTAMSAIASTKRRRAIGEIRRQRRAHDDRVADLERTHAAAMDASRHHHHAEIDAVDAAYVAKIDRLTASHDEITSRLRADHVAERDALSATVRKLGGDTFPLDAVAACRFVRRPLMNRPETALWTTIRDALGADGHVFPQVPYGVVLAPDPKVGHAEARTRATWELLRKRMDFLVTSATGEALAVIEYQGSGHYQGAAAYNDQIKKAVCARSNLRFIEIERGRRPDDVRAIVRELVGPNSSAAGAIAAE